MAKIKEVQLVMHWENVCEQEETTVFNIEDLPLKGELKRELLKILFQEQENSPDNNKDFLWTIKRTLEDKEFEKERPF